MKALGYAAVAAAFWLVRLTGHALARCGRHAAMFVLPLLAWCLDRRRQEPTRAPQNLAEHEASSLHPARAAVAQPAFTGQLEQAEDRALAVADRVVAIGLDPAVGVVHLRVYGEQRLVRRQLVVTEPFLRALLKGGRHTLPAVPYDPVEGLERIKEQAIAAAEAMINERGNLAVCSNRPSLRTGPQQGRAGESKQTANCAPPQCAAPPAQMPATPGLPLATLPAPQQTNGLTYVGKLVRAGPQTVTPEGRPSYEIFEAILQLDNGAPLSLRGAELQRELKAADCKLGQRLAITALGRLPVPLLNGGAGQKNLYRVRRLEHA